MSAQPGAALPLADYDHLPIESLVERLETLDINQVEQLIGYERNHLERTAVLDLLEQHRTELRSQHPGALGGG